MTRVADLIACLERLAPPELAEEWDNTGLLVGDRERVVARVLTCLTLSPDVAREAIAGQVSLVVTHHPVPFRPINRLTADDPQGRMLLELIAAGIAVYSPHTAYDNASEGINQQLAEQLALSEIEPLRPAPGAARFKIVCFVPNEHLQAVQEALWSAGAGLIGEYSKCSFVLEGQGTFLGSEASNPAIGQAGRLEQVAEARIEFVCPEDRVSEAVRRLRAAHPYEEPAYDVYPLKSELTNRGSGRTGILSPPLGGGGGVSVASPPLQGGGRGGRAARLSDLLALVKTRLKIDHLEYVGDPNRIVSRVGICCGSGGELLSAAIAKGCDVFLTGEARLHTSLEARAAGIALVLAGHYATERAGMERLAAMLQAEFPKIEAWASRTEGNPIRWA